VITLVGGLVGTPGALAGQYHGQTSQKSHDSWALAYPERNAILRPDRGAVSRSIAVSIGFWNVISIGEQNWSHFVPYRAAILRESVAEGQYQPRKGRYRLLIGLGVALGALYVGFLVVWYWATRIRPRAIDTNRRML
jgi:hypothetical protein